MRSRTAAYFDEPKARIEVIPMIDIMMFLLVFFIMITIDTIAGSGVKVDLPGSTTTQVLKETSITLGVAKDGALSIAGKPITVDDFKARIAEAKKAATVQVVIAGDREVPLQKLIDVMDLARGEGIATVGIAASKAAAPAPDAAPKAAPAATAPKK
ncbi:MAG: biopolymer transporter ExbD [Burkholderiales bacterium]|jgi:biopolymer transport protein ExbD|nr:biopolymer transporter ExbD [Burkholderiales bacterium]